MKRHYYLSEDLDELEVVEKELSEGGVSMPQMHVYSCDDASVENHHLHEVDDFMKIDVLHSMGVGAMLGVVVAMLSLLVSYLSGAVAVAGWLPFVCLSLLLWAFCVWEGGLFGMHKHHHQLQRFDEDVAAGKHLLFVDVNEQQEAILELIQYHHPHLKPVGEGASTPAWVIQTQNKWRSFVDVMP